MDAEGSWVAPQWSGVASLNAVQEHVGLARGFHEHRCEPVQDALELLLLQSGGCLGTRWGRL